MSEAGLAADARLRARVAGVEGTAGLGREVYPSGPRMVTRPPLSVRGTLNWDNVPLEAVVLVIEKFLSLPGVTVNDILRLQEVSKTFKAILRQRIGPPIRGKLPALDAAIAKSVLGDPAKQMQMVASLGELQQSIRRSSLALPMPSTELERVSFDEQATLILRLLENSIFEPRYWTAGPYLRRRGGIRTYRRVHPRQSKAHRPQTSAALSARQGQAGPHRVCGVRKLPQRGRRLPHRQNLDRRSSRRHETNGQHRRQMGHATDLHRIRNDRFAQGCQGLRAWDFIVSECGRYQSRLRLIHLGAAVAPGVSSWK